jgi:DNA polymerase eta
MREREAKSVCKDLICVKVPSKNGKADLTKYRDAGVRVAKVLQKFAPVIERASVDEGKENDVKR